MGDTLKSMQAPDSKKTVPAIPKPANYRKPTLIFPMPVEEELKKKEKSDSGRYCFVFKDEEK